MDLDKELPIPLYHQIKFYLEEKINSGQWEPGYQLPTEKELSLQFKVSNITIKRAIHDLVNKGLLYRQRGKGTFVSKKEDKDIYGLVTFRNESEDNANHPHKTLSFKKELAGPTLAKKMNLDQYDKVYTIHRLKIEGDLPIGIEYSHIPEALCPDLTETMIEDELLYNIFQNNYQLKFERAKIYFSTTLANDFESDLMQIDKGSQLFILERYTYTDERDVLEYSKFIVRQDKANYFIEVQL
ncbi:GntR family transcriptional regulator [Pseudalkalibacillus decolorationis]|uniref:GntR family transcriptional regulator n=1 Tax=Pseudalkalibacillus decolorationis TaxID=163879 RepID=UPI00214817A7|nr:GntR family transcriptional regulator [Pseudalkalibacillus decolorationis]